MIKHHQLLLGCNILCDAVLCSAGSGGASLDFHIAKITRLLIAVSAGQKGKRGQSSITDNLSKSGLAFWSCKT